MSVFQGVNSFQIFNSDFKNYNLSRIIQGLIINLFVILVVLFFSINEFYIILSHTVGAVISTIIVFFVARIGLDVSNLIYDFVSNLKKHKRVSHI